MIDVIDMDEDLGGDDAGQQTPPPPPVPPVQQIDPNVLASQITDRVMASINSQFQNGNQSERVTEKIVKEMLASGMPPQAVELITKFNMAAQQELVQAQQAQMGQRQWSTFIEQAHEHAEDVFDRYAAKLKNQYGGLDYARAGIIAEYHKKLESDPEYSREWQRLQSGKLPSSSGASKAMAAVLTDFIGKMTGAKAPPPVSLDSRKPVQGGGANSGGDLNSVDKRQRKQYLAFKKGKPEEFDAAAFERARRS